jgi:AraC-like DNA-binding protein
MGLWTARHIGETDGGGSARGQDIAPVRQPDTERYRKRLLQLASERSPEDLIFPRQRGHQPTDGPVRGSLYQHAVTGVEIALCVEGDARVATPREMVLLTPNRLLVLERGVFHAQLASSPLRGHTVTWLHLDGSRAFIGDSICRPSKGEVQCTLELVPGLLLEGRTNVESTGAAIASELGSRDWGYPRAVAGLLHYLVCILMRRLGRGPVVSSRATESPAIPGDQRTWSAIQKALEFCDENFRRRISHAEVGRAVGYSSRYLSHLMSTQLGQTLADHLRNLRIAEARRLLEETDLSIRAIADAVGYDDPAHFSRAFGRAVGVSPRAFRRHLAVH